MRRLALGIALGLALVLSAGPAAAERTVVLLLFDGFAPAMVDAVETPSLDRMRAEGVWSHGLVPAFPTISLINHVTVSTGCWPERHGFVTNVFLDPERGKNDHDGDADWLTGCEHLHQAAERQGVPAAAIGWIGSHSETRGPQATWVMPKAEHVCGPDLQGSASRDAARLERLVELLGRRDGPRVVMGYFCGPDGAAHFTGATSEATRAEVARSDAIIGTVMRAIEARRDAANVSLFVTTDHGMRRISQVVNIQRILDRHDIPAEPVSTGTTSFLYFDDPADSEAIARAARELAAYDEFEVLRRDALPDYARIGTGPRVGQLIVSAKPPYFIEDVALWPGWARWLASIGPSTIWARFALKDTHGYPPDVEGMHGILYGWGAGVAGGRSVPRVMNVDLHPTLSHLAGIGTGRPVDGSVADALLARPSSEGSAP